MTDILLPDPLFPHLLDIVSDPASDGLILAGGFGIRLKRAYLRQTGARTVIAEIPEARATQDLDFFLKLSLFIQTERGMAVRALLDRLEYKEATPKFLFDKPFDPQNPDGEKVKVDMLARWPKDDENIRVKPPRIGVDSGINLHGRETQEGFAVEESPLRLPVSGIKTDGIEVEASVLVPHPYAWLNLKVKAAHDWLRRKNGELSPKPHCEKHVFDVYVLTAMLTEPELREAADFAASYSQHPQAMEIRQCARELYASEEAEGLMEARRQAARELDSSLFREALWQALGIP